MRGVSIRCRPLVGALVAVCCFVVGARLAAQGRGASPTRLAWRDLPGVEVTAETVPVRLSAAALLMSGQSAGTLPIGLTATRSASPDEVEVLLEIAPVPPDVDGARRSLEVFLYGFSAEGDVVAARTHRIGPPDESDRSGVKLVATLSAVGAIHHLRALVHPSDSDDFGLAQARPAGGSGDPGARGAGLLLFEPFDGWRFVVGTGTVETLTPVRFGTNVLVPAARPVLRQDEEGFGGFVEPTAAGTKAIRLEPLLGGGTLERPLTDLGGGFFTFQATAVDRGRYAFWWSAGEDRLPEADLPTVRILDSDSAVAVWTALEPGDLGEREGWETRLTSSLTEEERKALSDRLEFRAAYGSVLELLASDDDEGARNQLQDFEVGMGSEGASGFVTLTRMEWQSLRALLDDDFEFALPIALMHARQVVDYLQIQHHQLVEHSLKMTARIADERASFLKTPEAKRQAADILIDLAGLVRGRPTVRERLYASALEIDRTNARAWLSRAAHYERRGLYDEALEDLEQALKREPALPEARLRWAVCQSRRARRRARAEDVLSELIGDPTTPSWVGAIAAQELARIRMGRGDQKAALDALQRGLARWPEDPQLSILTSYVLDEAGSRDASKDMLRRAEQAAPETDLSPRTRYNLFARDELLGHLERMAKDAEVMLPSLSEQLGGAGQ